ncbi:MAG TPA: thioesterase family protein [Blastocatellia bacterium]|jgi:acyl-CoA thioester hydrolase
MMLITSRLSGMMRPVRTDFRFHHTLRVRFAETDLQGIVFNGNYLTYYDVAWTEYFRAFGMQWKDLIEMGADTVLARTTLEFKSPAKFDEVLEVYTRVSKVGNTSMTFDFEIYPEGEDRLIGAASSLYVCIDPKTLKPVRVPEQLRSRINEFEGKDL